MRAISLVMPIPIGSSDVFHISEKTSPSSSYIHVSRSTEAISLWSFSRIFPENVRSDNACMRSGNLKTIKDFSPFVPVNVIVS